MAATSKCVTPRELHEIVGITSDKFKNVIGAEYNQHFSTLMALDGKDSKRVKSIATTLNRSHQLYRENLCPSRAKDWSERCRLDSVVYLACKAMFEKFE